MRSYYFTISLWKRGNKLQFVVEMEHLSRVARFILASEGLRVNTHHDCTVKVEKSFVSMPLSENVLLEEFKVSDIDVIKRMALEA